MASNYDSIRRNNETEYGRGVRLLEFAKKNFPRRAHFLLELLQNAEDVGAETINFVLSRGGIEIRHDGRRFNESEVRGVCGIGESTKTGDLTQIGTFGVGFKSVELYTCSPEVHCGDEHFVIERGFFPRAAQKREPGEPFTTLFVLPFDNHEMPPDQAFREIADRLDSLSARTLLFLQSVHRVEWVIEDGTSRAIERRQCAPEGPSRVVILAEPDSTIPGERWLVFQRPVAILGNNKAVRVEVAFQLEESHADSIGRIVRVNDSPLVVFFPTDKPTQLGFLIQGAYRTTLARDNIPEDDAWNRKLVKETAALVADALPKLRDLGLLTVGVLETMPIDPSDFLEDRMFRPIFERVREALREQPLLPTHDGSFVAAKNAKVAEENDLRELLSSEELRNLFVADAQWISGEVAGELRGYLLNELDVEEFTWDKLVRRLDAAFIQQRTDEWLAKFYGLLNKRPHLWRSPRGSWDSGGLLRDKPFIRLEDGSQVAPFREDPSPDRRSPNAYLPPPDETDYPIVKRRIVADEAAHDFLLNGLRLKTPNNVTEVLDKVLPKYQAAQDAKELRIDEHARDIDKILRALDTATGDEKNTLERRLKETPFLRATNVLTGESALMRPDTIYVPSRELQLYFEGSASAHFLANEYTEHQAEAFCQLGVSRTVRLRCRPADDGGRVAIADYHSWHQRGLHRFDPDAEIDGLDNALRNPAMERAAYVWNELLVPNRHLMRGIVESSRRQTFEDANRQEKLSEIGKLVCELSWLPCRSGTFQKPEELSLDELADDFIRDEGLASALGMRHVQLEALARQAGMVLVRVEEYEEFERWRAHQSKPDFPVREPDNPDLRKERLREEAGNAAEKEYQQRLRIVRTSDDVQKDAKTYLRELYTNDDGRMICQACRNEMPFKLDDGSYYFEAVECVKDDKELRGNHLALCPICAAKYRHANGSSPEQIREGLLGASCLEIPVILVRERHTIRFVEVHLQDLQAALQSASAPKH